MISKWNRHIVLCSVASAIAVAVVAANAASALKNFFWDNHSFFPQETQNPLPKELMVDAAVAQTKAANTVPQVTPTPTPSPSAAPVTAVKGLSSSAQHTLDSFQSAFPDRKISV